MDKTLKNGGLSKRKKNVSRRENKKSRNIYISSKIRRKRNNIKKKGPTNRNAEGGAATQLYGSLINIYPSSGFERLYDMLNYILRGLNGILNNDTFTGLLAFFSSQYIMSSANSIYRFVSDDMDDINTNDRIIHAIASNIIMYLLWESMELIRSGRPREIIYLLYYYVMIERNLRLEEIKIENEKEQITEQEYIQRMGVLRDKYREWERIIGRGDRFDEDNILDMMNFGEELHATHAEEQPEEPQVNTAVVQCSLEDILSQYNTTDTNVALQRAISNQDRNSIRIIMTSRE